MVKMQYLPKPILPAIFVIDLLKKYRKNYFIEVINCYDK